MNDNNSYYHHCLTFSLFQLRFQRVSFPIIKIINKISSVTAMT